MQNRFEKVTFEQFRKDFINILFCGEDSVSDEVLQEHYDIVKIPRRATSGSAGYDFVTPINIVLKPHESITIPTGIRCFLGDGCVLMCYPRSGLGFKYGMMLSNTVGIIDSDYVNSDNQGHIMAKIVNNTTDSRTLEIKAGERFMQGIITRYYTTDFDITEGERNGGFGSTGN